MYTLITNFPTSKYISPFPNFEFQKSANLYIYTFCKCAVYSTAKRKKLFEI